MARDPPPKDPADRAAYRAALGALYRRRRFGMRPGLEVVRRLLRELGDPQRSFRAVHVAGSKGKGSVAALIASALSQGVGPTGLYTSPHLQSYRERIRIDDDTIPRADVVEGLTRVERAARQIARRSSGAREPTFFEVTTALAFDWFRERGIAQAVVEVGLGGRFDATNVLDAPVGVITTLELEHTEILGPTLRHIAREKAGILHPGMRVVLGESKREPRQVVERAARRLGLPIWRLGEELLVRGRHRTRNGQKLALETPRRRHSNLRIPLFGEFQASNAALAVGALDAWAEATGRRIPEAAIRSGFRRARWRGRLERVASRPAVFVDVAHTPESARAVVAALHELAPNSPPSQNVIVFGCVQLKAYPTMLETLASLAQQLVVVPLRSDRGEEPSRIATAASAWFPRVLRAPSVEAGLTRARSVAGVRGLILAVGSDYLAGELLNSLEGRPEDEPDLSDPGLRGPGVAAIEARP